MVYSFSRGGLICLAYDFLAAFVAEWKDYNTDYSSVVWSPYDLRSSWYTTDILETSQYGARYFPFVDCVHLCVSMD